MILGARRDVAFGLEGDPGGLWGSGNVLFLGLVTGYPLVHFVKTP